MDQWLSAHPHIFMAEKEAHYFNTDHRNRKFTRLPDYQALLNGAAPQHVRVGETSTRYLYSRDAVANILRYQPAAVFIVLLRNPVEMVASWHNQVCFSGLEAQRDLATAWRLQAQRKVGKAIPKKCAEVKMLFYGEVCSLGGQLQRLYQQVARARVHVILFDDLRDQPRPTYLSALNFLQVADDGKYDLPIYNQARTYYSRAFNWLLFGIGHGKRKMRVRTHFGILEWLRKNNYRIRKNKPLSPAMKQTLLAYFADDIHLLENLLERDLTHWKK